MKSYILMSLMVAIVLGYLFLKVTGRIRLSELEILPVIAIRTMLFIVSGSFYALLIAKFLRATWGYDATPLSIAIYLIGIVAALVAAFYTTRWLTDEKGVF